MQKGKPKKFIHPDATKQQKPGLEKK